MKLLAIVFILVFAFTAFGQVTQKIYRDEKYSFSISYPSDWKPAAASSVHTRFKVASNGGFGLADFSIVVITPKEIKGMTSAEFANGLVARPHIVKAMVNTGLPDGKILSSGKTYLSNREAFFVKYTGTLRTLDDRTDLTVYQIITVFEDKSITLTCRALKPVFDAYFDTCKEIVAGFVLIPTKITLPAKPKTKVMKTARRKI